MATLVSRLAEPGESGRLRHGRWWAAIAAAVLVGGLALYVSYSSAFHLQHLKVEGNSHLTGRDVVELSGLSRRTNLLWLDTGSVERRLESSPWVAVAAVSKTFPRTVLIEITERTPVAVVPGYGGFRLMAADGASMGVVGTAPHLPLIVMPPPRATQGPAPSPAGAATAVAGLDPKLRSLVGSVVVDMDGSLLLHLRTGVQVEYGEATQIALKSRVIRSMLRWANLNGRSLRTVNVSAPEAPAASFGS